MTQETVLITDGSSGTGQGGNSFDGILEFHAQLVRRPFLRLDADLQDRIGPCK